MMQSELLTCLAYIGAVVGLVVQCVLIVVLIRALIAFEKIANAMDSASRSYSGRKNETTAQPGSDQFR